MLFVQHNSCISLAEMYSLNNLLSCLNRKVIKTINQNGNLKNTGIMLSKRHNMSFNRYISANEKIEF